MKTLKLDTHKVEHMGYTFLVTMERIKNGVNGNPRYAYQVICLDTEEAFKGNCSGYLGEKEEAKQVVYKLFEEVI